MRNLAALCALLAMACSNCSGNTSPDSSSPEAEVETEVDPATVGPDPALFAEGALEEIPTTEACTLANGTEATCYRITITGVPANHDVGPFCPRNISDGADAGGLWIESGETWDLSGAFIANLDEFYDDPNWVLYDPETGDVNVTDTLEACEAAARPDVDPAYRNHCVECPLDELTDLQTITLLLPVTPVRTTGPAEIDFRSKIGVSLSGVVFDPPAPVDAILGAHTIAAFDDCGGHVNPVTGYHYHAATGCSAEEPQADGHAPLLGYAIDGFGMYGMLDEQGSESQDLDVCRGHEDEIRGYHYHVASPGENQFIGCLMGEAGTVLE